MATCTKCNQELPESDFNVRKSGKLHSWCKKCTNKSSENYRRKNLDRYAKNAAKQRIANPECESRNKKKYYQSKKGKYAAYRGGAQHRNLEFLLTFEEFCSFWQKPCHYCGEKPETVGLDRVDSDKGYILNNIVSCCSMCNRIKSDFTVTELLMHIKKMIQLQEQWSNSVQEAL